MKNKILWFDTIDSTNKYTKEHHNDLESGTVIAAKHQNSGYGRRNREWEDEGNTNLTFSILLKLPFSERISLLTQVAAASVHQTLLDKGIKASIKWPNDILVNNKKISGILLETILEKNYVSVTIGIGINVNALSFSEELQHKATSMAIEKSKLFNIEEMLTLFLENMNNSYISYIEKTDEFLFTCRKNSFLIGKEVFLDEENKKPVYVKDIDYLGRLVVVIDNKEVLYTGSEVSLTNMYDN